MKERYQLGEELRRSSGSVFYLGVDRRDAGTVLIQRLLADLQGDTEALDRAEHEARVLSTHWHPSLVKVFDVFRGDGDLFVVMDPVEGKTLAEEVKQRGPILSYRALPLFESLAAGLVVAHLAGVVHGAIHPRNVFIGKNDQPVLVGFDFGARRDGDPSVEEKFLAPEVHQAGAPLNTRTDVYGLAATLYFCLTGQCHDKLSEPELALMRRMILQLRTTGWTVEGPPTPNFPHEWRIPPALQDALFRALDDDPWHRPARIEDLLKGMKKAEPPSLRAQLRGLILGFAVFSVLLVVLLLAGLSQKRVSTPVDNPGAFVNGQPPEIERVQVNPEVATGSLPSASAMVLEQFQVRHGAGGGHACGFIRNAGQEPLQRPSINLVFYDSQGNELLRAKGDAFLEQIDPGRRSPFKVVLSAFPEGYTRIATEVRAAPLPSPQMRLARLEVLAKTVEQATAGLVQLAVTVRNEEPVAVSQVEAVAVFYDERGQILDVARVAKGEAIHRSLGPGEESELHLALMPPGGELPASYDIFLDAAVGQP